MSRSTPKERKKKVALVLARKLAAASEAMQLFLYAGLDCGEPYPNLDDQRKTLGEAMAEYSGYLLSVYDK